MYVLLKMGIFHCFVGLPEGIGYNPLILTSPFHAILPQPSTLLHPSIFSPKKKRFALAFSLRRLLHSLHGFGSTRHAGAGPRRWWHRGEWRMDGKTRRFDPSFFWGVEFVWETDVFLFSNGICFFFRGILMFFFGHL